MWRPTALHIDSKALWNNLEVLKKCLGPGTFFCPMVKANAYGHGDTAVAAVVERFPGVSAAGVALVEEGMRLRQAGLRLPVLVFAPFDASAASAMLTHQLTPVVGRLEDLHALARVSGRSPVGVHLKFNTGMARLGFDAGEIPALRQALRDHPALRVDGVCTHLTHGEDAFDPEGPSARQFTKLQVLSEGFPGARHAHKSSSLAVLSERGLAPGPGLGARVGISLYGLPYEAMKVAPGLKPVLRWTTQLVRVHQVEGGESVSYGGRWVARGPSTIGVLPVGYGDGYLRALSNRGEVLFRGRRAPVAGSVCMDYTLIDLTAVCGDGRPQPGEEVVLIGSQGAEEVSAGFLAERAGTIAYEIVTAIQQRVAREVT